MFEILEHLPYTTLEAQKQRSGNQKNRRIRPKPSMILSYFSTKAYVIGSQMKYPEIYLRVGTKKLFFLFVDQNICCGYSKEQSH